MKSLMKLSVLAIGIAIMTGCSSPSTSTNPQAISASSSATPSAPQATKSDSEKKSGDGHDHKEGANHTEAVKVGDYSMELESHKEGDELHFDFHLHKGKDEVMGAKVTAQLQMPDGSQKSMEMPFDAKEKAYVAKLENSAAGEYKVAVLTDLKGEKMNARFTIKQ